MKFNQTLFNQMQEQNKIKWRDIIIRIFQKLTY